jgi:hypothetical protein
LFSFLLFLPPSPGRPTTVALLARLNSKLTLKRRTLYTFLENLGRAKFKSEGLYPHTTIRNITTHIYPCFKWYSNLRL